MKLIPSYYPEKIYPGSTVLLYLLLLTFTCISQATSGQQDFCAVYQQDVSEYNRDDKSSANETFAKGLLWKVKNREGNSSYLFGTIHSQDHRITRVPPAVRLAIVQSDVLLLEVVPDQKAESTFISSIYADKPYNLNNLLHKNIYERIENKIADYGIPIDRLDQIKLWAIFSIMGRPKPVNALSLESVLKNIAQSANRQIAGIETMDEIVAALDSLEINDQVEIVNDTICNHDKIIRETATLVQLYLDRNLAGIMEFNNLPHRNEAVFNRFMNKLVYERNNRMLETMKKYLDRGQVFVAVGAMHLAGEKGLLISLQKGGYQLERI